MTSPQVTNARALSPPRRLRACLPCTKAKARCLYETDEVSDGCNRCRRLKIKCDPQTTKSLRKPRQLKTRGPTPVPTPDDSASPGPSSLGSIGDSGTEMANISASTSDGDKHRDDTVPLSPGFGVSWHEADRAVAEYTTIFTAHFPFIILEHDITTRRLFMVKPLLLRAILMTTVHLTIAKRREIKRSVDAWIGQHLLVMNEPSLGVLQGLIVYLAWGNPHFYSDRRQTQMIYLGLGLAHSLGITSDAVKTESEINEEHRAFLACYYIVALRNPLSSSHAQYCLESLERSAEFPTDFLLIKLVKYRLFIERVPSLYEDILDTTKSHVSLGAGEQRFREFREELNAIMDDVTHSHPKLLLLWTLTRNALIQLYLPMTYMTAETGTTTQQQQLQLECMRECLEAARPFLEMVRAISPDGILYCPFTTLADFSTMFIAISRLLLLDISGWDPRAEELDAGALLDEFLAKCDEARKVQVERFAAAARDFPSSHVPDGPGEAAHNRILILREVVQSFRDFLCGQGLLLAGEYDDMEIDDDHDGPASTARLLYVGAGNPQWNFEYFFRNVLNMKEPDDP
ncbi:hypothetical protein F5Y17DRAFT_469167 [Xylariaceae sp. FL0594]|nr:hypothetical protein F5Y17DRAFT_469167 [Xylariaceae sp. FL0594]